MFKNRAGFHILLLTALSLATFWGTVGHDFVTTWDDDKYVITNEIIRSFSVQNIRSAFSTFFLGNYAPLQIISYMGDYLIAGLNPAVYHLHNVILQVLNGLLCYLLFFKVTGRRDVACIGACLFLVHPVQVETVAWISQRKNLLSMFFFLPALISYIHYRETEKKVFYWFSLGCFLLSLLAKPVTVVLPAILIAFDLLRTRRTVKEALVDKIPFILLALIFSFIALNTQMPEQGGGRAGFYGGSRYATMMTMIPVFCRYLLNIVWPLHLSADYLIPVKTAPDVEVISGGLALICLILLLWRISRKRREVLFWPVTAALAILPVSQIFPIVTLMNDRYLYFPMVGIAPMIALGIVNMSERPNIGKMTGVVMGFWLLSLPILAHKQASVWRNGITLWQSVLEKTPQNHLAVTSLADSYREAGNPEEALRLYRQALSLNPDYFMALNNISTLLLNSGSADEAEPFIHHLVRKYPKYPRGFEMLGLERELAGDMAGAELAYTQALYLDPDLVESSISMAAMLLKKGDTAGGERLLLRAREKAGDIPEVAYSMACLETQKGRIPEALAELQKVGGSGTIDISAAWDDPCFAAIRNNPAFMAKVGRRSIEK